MNKYQEALEWLMEGNDPYSTEWDLLEELVEKATPKKVVKWLNDRSMACCPQCGAAEYAEKNPKHCHYCGQAIDWSDKNDV